MEYYCQLISSSSSQNSSSSPPVELRHKETVRLGRDGATGGTGQVEVTADIDSKEVLVRQLSPVCSSVAGVLVLQREGETAIIGPGAKLELMTEKDALHIKYNIFFGQKKAIEVANTRPGETEYAQGDSVVDMYTCRWDYSQSLLVMEYGPQSPSPLVAAFDLDSTLIKTRSGRLPFKAAGPDDWTFWMPCVPHKLLAAEASGYRIVIFTNQGGMNYGNPPLSEFKLKLESVMKELGRASVLLLASLEDDEYRKPRTKMWEYFIECKNEGVMVDMNESYYVGDAAGRPKHVKKDGKADFSCSDRKFAANIKINFSLPEEFFLGEPTSSEFSWYGFNPRTYTPGVEDGPSLEPRGTLITREAQEIVVFVGPPAAGKSQFYKDYMRRERNKRHYSHVSRDLLGSWQKCVTECREGLVAGYSAVIDNTSPDIESRGRYIQLGSQCGVPVRCFWFMTSLEHALHNNQYRNHCIKLKLYKDDIKKMVPDSALRSYKSRFVEPSLAEGFSEIVKIKISLHFPNKMAEDLYMKFWD
ncbi:PREDICTED: uncharacterized protein F21D5.5-like [Amphimedon queenslandica]|uniref:PNK FHA domain-containing protein n=1 Tax=Amphimedon queenslandica TaxID=400682 RepID=A0AAN0IEH9_AMPQE|nr:PREDICTED: uncharacterized protein F21D5.5-like [Amphimedon queenslandica]|eukprot:XP_003386914.1 PREDICTED: uncharacterized protein F21D5.5-like [Amphimedon queenslandica]